jgi:hypothetical protein
MIRTMSRTTAALAATLSIAVLGLATSVAERVMREAHAGASRAAVSHQGAAENASAQGVHARAWYDLPPPATETVWCVNDDAIYAACGDRSERVRPELQH